MGLVITISGLHGTGKSTYARIISESLNLRHVSAGELFRQIALEKRLSVSELSEIASKDRGVDDLVDEHTRREARQGDVVLDGLLTGWMAREEADLKIFLTASERVRVERIANRDGTSYSAARKATLLRERLERRRFKKFYGINIDDTSIYDLVLNTALLPLEDNAKILERFIREYKVHRGK